MGPAFSCQAFCILEFKKLSGEAAACPDYSEWLHQFKRDILPLYDPRDVFNADETALMWRACSGFSFVLSGEHPEGDANQMLQILRQIQETLMHSDLDYTVVEGVIAQVDKIPLRQTTLLQMWKTSVKQ